MDHEALLQYWFGPDDAPFAYPKDRARIWWGKRHDAEITERFGPWLERAEQGDFDDWAHAPRSMLALILLFDQITRTVRRGTPGAFASDARARERTREALDRGFEDPLRPVERAFLYLPLTHSEELDDHARAVQLYSRLVDEVPPGACHDAMRRNLRSAIRHRDVIERFGRYPHRNAILGRTSTPEEEAFLALPGSRF